MEFKKVESVESMQAIMIDSFKNTFLEEKTVSINNALNKILAEDVYASCNVPHFDRSVVDGYAVKTMDVQGASEGIPVILNLVDKVNMGETCTTVLEENQCIYVPTGGMMPKGADAVVMIEYCEKLADDEVLIYKSASKHQHMLKIGDDIQSGSLVFNKGKMIYSQDIGALSSIGILAVDVYQAPKVTVLSTGDEIVSPESDIVMGKIRDINTFSLSAKIESWGGKIVKKFVIKDSYEQIKETIVSALSTSDIVFLSGGSSVGEKDYTLKILNEIDGSNILINGLNIKPGKPTIVANVNGKPVIGLPGQPASAFMVLDQLLDILYQIYYSTKPLKSFVLAELNQNIAATTGRKTLQMVSLCEKDGKFVANVLRGKSGMISLITQSFGYIIIEENSEGQSKGQVVKVYPLR